MTGIVPNVKFPEAGELLAVTGTKESFHADLGKRSILQPQARLGGVTADRIIDDIIEKTRVPVTRIQ